MITIGIDLGGTNIAAGLVNEAGKIIARDSTPTKAGRPYDEIMADMGTLVQKLLRENKFTEEDVKYVGIGAPGVLDNKKGTVTDNGNLHWVDYPITAKLQPYIHKPIYLGNDANVAAWAEYVRGCGKGAENFIMLTLGTGVGGGIILNGKLYTGSHNIGAEIGHTPLKAGGELCGCGNKGCMEAYCSATALIRNAKREAVNVPESAIAKANVISAKTVIDAAKAGDELGVRLFQDYVSDLAQAIAGIINFLDPDIIALGGGVANAGEFLLEPLRREVPKHVTFPGGMATRLLSAQMGNDAGIMGAALLGEG